MTNSEDLHLIWWVFGSAAGVLVFLLVKLRDLIHAIDKRLVRIEAHLGITNGKTKLHDSAG
jgi:hypothetical protein